MSCDTCKSHSPPAGAHFCSWQSAIDPSRRLQFRSLPRAVSSVTFSGGVGCRVGWETEGFCVTSPSTGTASSMRFLQSPRVGGENRQISFFCAAPGWRFRSRAISGIGNTSHPPRHPPTHALVSFAHTETFRSQVSERFSSEQGANWKNRQIKVFSVWVYRLLRNRRNFLIASKLFLAGLPTLVVEALARNDSKVFKLLSAYKYGPVTAYNTPTLRHRIMTKRACFSFPRLNPSFTLAEAL